MKSIFILTYLDYMELRQRIQKQLNKVELSNKFSKAVFFANNQEFKCGTQDEQEIAAACSVLIQNAIVLWNYLTVSQCLAGINDIEERNKMVTLKPCSRCDTLPPPKFQSVAMKFLVGASCDPYC